VEYYLALSSVRYHTDSPLERLIIFLLGFAMCITIVIRAHLLRKIRVGRIRGTYYVYRDEQPARYWVAFSAMAFFAATFLLFSVISWLKII
jgi:predicted membrane protein